MNLSAERNTSMRTLIVISVLLLLGGCVSTGYKNIPSAQIQHAPAIDVSYREVVKDIANNYGVNVRWGGQIIEAEDINEVTRLTVIALPLDDRGRPIRGKNTGFEGGRFILEMINFDESSNHQLITAYGQVVGEERLTNGNKQISIPIIAALESQDWPSRRRSYAGEFHLGLPYNGLAYHYYGHGFYSYGRYYSPYYYGYRGSRSHRHWRHH